MIEIDAQIQGIPGIWYKRYVDDILVLTPEGKASEVASLIIGGLQGVGLSPHPLSEPNSKSKVSSLLDSFNFLGYKVEAGGVSIRQESVLRFESSLARIFTAYRHKLARSRSARDKERAIAYCQWKLDLRITGCIFEGRRLGWVAYFSQISDTKQLRLVNYTVAKLSLRFGLGSEIKPKSLIKTFYELRRGDKATHKYIPNFDALTVAQQRGILGLSLGVSEVRKLSDMAVERRFKLKIAHEVKELEVDVSGFS
ncbi:hypothetical protein D9M71_378470 [compost metagenome]